MIVDLAHANGGVVTRAQLEAAGVGRRAIAHRLGCGRLYRRHAGVYLLTPAEDAGRITLLIAALISVGAEGRLSHGTAAAVWGLTDEQPPAEPIDIMVVNRNPGERDSVRLHRVTELPAIDQRTHRRLAVTSVVRTILDLASERQRPSDEIEQAAGVALRRRLTSASQLRAVLRRYPRHPGAHRLRAILDQGPAMTRSRGERRCSSCFARPSWRPR